MSSTGESTPTANPVIGKATPIDVEMGDVVSSEDRNTLAPLRAGTDVDYNYVRSVPDVLLTKDTAGNIMGVAYGITGLQLTVSLMVMINNCTNRTSGTFTYQNFVTYCAASVAIACSVNESAVEFWVNNRCLEMMKQENKGDAGLKKKDSMVTLYFFAQLALVVATVVSISQQTDPVGIITNCTGLLLIQELDSKLFSVLKLRCEYSHLVKEKVKVVLQNRKYSAEYILTISFGALLLGILIASLQ